MTTNFTLRAAVATGTILAAGLLAGAAAAQDLVISNWDGYMAPDAIAGFTAATGFGAELVLHATNEEIMGKLMASGGAGYDVVFVSSPFAEILSKMGLAETLDHAKLPNLANLYPEATALAHDPGNTFSVPYAWGTTGLCYRADLLAEAPDSWNDLLQPAADVAGKTTMLATDRWLLAAGFLANGLSVNATGEDDLNKVRDALIAAKKTLLAYDDTTFYSKLVSGEAVLVQAWDGWCNYGIAENDQIRYAIPAEGSDLWVDTMVIMAGSQNKDAAYAFVNHILDAANHRWAAENILYKVPNKPAMEGLDPALVAQFPNMGMGPAELLGYEQLRDVGEAQRDYARVVTEIMAAQ
jgi:spermidine/putrescine transport system substrate-binding protein